MSSPFTIALCEGFHDRAFLGGALTARLGWTDPSDGGKRKLRDAFGAVAGGDHGYAHPGGARLRIRPCHGDLTRVRKSLADIVVDRNTKEGPLARVLLCVDGDVGGDGPDAVERARRSVTGLFVERGWAVETLDADRWRVDDAPAQAPPVEVRLALWRAEAFTGPPAQQCLERVVCAAVDRAWPDRYASVVDWLGNRPTPSRKHAEAGTGPKSYAWAVMAGWFAEHGCDDFYRDLWRDEAVAPALIALLGPAWAHLEALALAVSPVAPG